jgi:S-adenosylmethionine:diacylglycerol 3-amino-3-carboxypropyl transferase
MRISVLMSSFRKLSLLRINGITLVGVTIDGKRRVFVNEEAVGITREVIRLLGLRHCTTCGRLVKAEELGYVEIIGNKVVKAVCMDCLKQLHSQIIDIFSKCAYND